METESYSNGGVHVMTAHSLKACVSVCGAAPPELEKYKCPICLQVSALLCVWIIGGGS